MVLTKVSIVIPVYNAARCLRRCLDSIAAQTFKGFKVVAVDDGSTDGSGDVLNRYEASFPLVRIHQENHGVSAARNRALAAADGEYVMFLDADDVIHPRLLEWTVAALKGTGLDFVMYDYRRVPDADAHAVDWSSSPPPVARLVVPAFDGFVTERRVPGPCQFLFRRETLCDNPFEASISIYEDVPFVLGYLAARHRGVHVRGELYGYVTMERSQSHNSPIAKRLAGVEAGMRLMSKRLDARQYRLYAKTCCSSWIMDLWREIHALPRGAERTMFRAKLYAFIRRTMADGLIGLSDFRFGRRLRLLYACLHGFGGTGRGT